MTTTPPVGYDLNQILNLDRDIKAALSLHQGEPRTPREATLEGLLWRALTSLVTLHTNLHAERDKSAALLQKQAGSQQEIHWIDKLLAVPASIMSPSHKITLRAAVKAYLSSTPDEQGLVHIESWKVCKQADQSKDTFLKNLTYCTEQLGILRKQVERPGLAVGDFSATLSIGVTDLLAHPEKYTVAMPRQHGGLREICPHCHSERLKKKVIVVCQDCGAIISEHASEINPDAKGNLPREHNQQTQGQLADESLEAPEPTTPPAGEGEGVESGQDHNDGQAEASDQRDQVQPSSQADKITAAAQLLVEIAGPAPVHIEMSSCGPKKYYDVHRSLAAQDALDHLTGKKTKGGLMRRPNGMTRALAYDADTDEDWETLTTAARFLTYGDYVALLEPSPVGRGGHLWVLYSDLVQTRDAQRHLRQYAQMLGKVKEFWPGSPNKVRLPGGKYVKPGFAAWCKLSDAHGKPLASNGAEAAHVLLTSQNPASMVPEYPPDPEPAPGPTHEPGGSPPLPAAPAGDTPNSENQACTSAERSTRQAMPWVNQRWQEKYGRYLWFQFTPAQLAEWYNTNHEIQEMLPAEKNGMGLASWRGERTASVGYTKDGEGWVDFGASAARPGGKRDGGDALELATRITQETKLEVMRQAARALVSEARAAMESAGRSGQLPPAWVQAFMSPAGWQRYKQLCHEHGHQVQCPGGPPTPDAAIQAQEWEASPANEHAEDAGGVAGSCARSPVYDTPEALAAEIGAEIGEPCNRCGCTLHYQSGSYVMCYKCHPRPLRLGGLNDEQWRRLRTLFPRRAYLTFA